MDYCASIKYAYMREKSQLFTELSKCKIGKGMLKVAQKFQNNEYFEYCKEDLNWGEYLHGDIQLGLDVQDYKSTVYILFGLLFHTKCIDSTKHLMVTWIGVLNFKK